MILQPPILPEETAGEATIRIKLNMPNLLSLGLRSRDVLPRKWRKDGEEVDVRMLNLVTCSKSIWLTTMFKGVSIFCAPIAALHIEDSCDTRQTWPHSLTMWANGTQAAGFLALSQHLP